MEKRSHQYILEDFNLSIISIKKLFLNALKSSGQVAVVVMDSFNVNKKNPYKFNYVKKELKIRQRIIKTNLWLLKFPL